MTTATPTSNPTPAAENEKAKGKENAIEATNRRLEDLIVITSHLAELLEKENTALREHHPQEIAAYMEEKDKLARTYEKRIKSLREHPQLLAEADGELKERLKLIGDKVRDLMEENARLLKIALDVGRRFMDSVAEAVKTASRRTGTYGANGSVGGAQKNAPRTLSMSLNQSL